MPVESDPTSVKLNTVTRRFNDDRLETKFRSSHIQNNLGPMIAGALVGWAALIGYALITLHVAGTSNPLTNRLIWMMAMPILLAVFLAKKYFSTRLTVVEVLVGFTLSWIGVCYNWTLIQSVPAGTSLLLGYGVNIIFLIFAYVLLRLRFLPAISTGAVITLSFIPVAYEISHRVSRNDVVDFETWFWGDPSVLTRSPFIYLAGIVVISNAILATSAYVFETLERKNFLAKRIIARQQGALQEEKANSERLLLNVLPGSIAERLMQGENSIADGFDDITVLFADIVNFTPLSEQLPPVKILEMLNQIFTEFDHIIAKHQIEKIKTVGDAYMAVSGAPEHKKDHIRSMALAGLELLEASATFTDPTGNPLALRIGIHTGPAIAGVIGAHKFAYDLWGDTVNVASRLESNGEAGRIQVSEAVFRHLKDEFEFEERGTISVKGKGDLATWWLLGKKR